MGWSTNHPNGLIHYAPQQAYRGYTLVTNANGNDTRLIDMEGRVCHTWHSNEGIAYAYLLANGNLLLRTGPAAEETSFPEPARAGDPAPRREDGLRGHPGARLGGQCGLGVPVSTAAPRL